jgi:hypothetical protein
MGRSLNRSTALMVLFSVLVPEVRAQQFNVKTHAEEQDENSGSGRSLDSECGALHFYRIGSRNERPGTTGLSHYFST